MKLKFENESVHLPLVEDQVDLNDLSENVSPEVLRLLEDGIKAAKDGERADARYLLLRVTEADPKCESAWLWLASISEYPEELMVFLNNVLGINPGNQEAKKWANETKAVLANSLVKRGRDAAKENNEKVAKQSFLHAIVHDNKNENAWFELASVSDSNREKISHLQKVLDINPENKDALETLEMERKELAQSLLSKACYAQESGEDDEARKLLEEILEGDYETDQAWILKAQLTESFEEKVENLERALEINEENEKARELLENTKSERAESLMPQARAAFDAKDEDEARRLLAEILQSAPEYEDAWILEAQLEDSFERKLYLLEKVLSINPKNEEARELIQIAQAARLDSLLSDAKDAAANDDRDIALKLLEDVLAVDPELEEALLLSAKLAESMDDKDSFLRQVLHVNPENEEAQQLVEQFQKQKLDSLLSEATEALENDNKNDAEKLLQKILEIEYQCEEAWLLKVDLAESSEDKEAFIKRVLRINPENEKARELQKAAKKEAVKELLAKANSAASSGDNQKASTLLKEIFAYDDAIEEAWLLKSQLTDSFSEKIDCFERILEINPENEVVSSNLSALTSILQSPVLDQKAVSQQREINGETQELIFRISRSENGDLELETTTEAENAEDLKETDETLAKSADDDSKEDEMSDASQDLDVFGTQFGDLGLITDELGPIPDTEVDTPEDVLSLDNPDVKDEVLRAEIVDQEDMDLKPILMPESAEELNFAENGQDSQESQEDTPVDEVIKVDDGASEVVSDESDEVTVTCQFCENENKQIASVCGFCGAILSLSDIELFFSNPNEPNETILKKVEDIEAEQEARELEFGELHMLGLGHLNLGNYQTGFDYLTKASQLNPDDVLLIAQIDSLSKQLSEMDARDVETDSASKTILVVDDSATVRKLISGKLEKTGHKAICAVDGVDALEMLEEAQPDLILLDIAMPRMDGYEVCKMIRANEATKDVPVIMISGKDGFFDKVQGKLAGSTSFIAKPFGPETLMRLINEYI